MVISTANLVLSSLLRNLTTALAAENDYCAVIIANGSLSLTGVISFFLFIKRCSD